MHAPPLKGTIIVPNTATTKAIRDEQVLIDDEKWTLVVSLILKKATGQTGDNGTKDVEIMVPLSTCVIFGDNLKATGQL